MTDVLAAGEGSSAGDEESERLWLSVSKQWAGLCFRKVEEQSEKVDLQLPECTLGNQNVDVSAQTAKTFMSDIQTDETAIDGEEEDDRVSLTRALNNHHYA